jgi:hypothetical protein
MQFPKKMKREFFGGDDKPLIRDFKSVIKMDKEATQFCESGFYR